MFTGKYLSSTPRALRGWGVELELKSLILCNGHSPTATSTRPGVTCGSYVNHYVTAVAFGRWPKGNGFILKMGYK
jgi:hypothetical protein